MRDRPVVWRVQGSEGFGLLEALGGPWEFEAQSQGGVLTGGARPGKTGEESAQCPSEDVQGEPAHVSLHPLSLVTVC